MKAQEFLGAERFASAAVVIDAKKVRYGREEALALAKSATTVVAAKGAKATTFDMKDPPDDDTLAAALLGPTGNLKAPTLRVGDTLLVGFGAGAYGETFGAT